MKRALLVVCLAVSPAAAQVSPYSNPYNPYVSSSSGGTLQFRPYISLDRLNVQYQSRVIPLSYGAMGGTNWNVANVAPRAAAFRYYLHYPMMNAAGAGTGASGNPSAKSLQPLPFSAAPPVETACDPYQDEDGCLSEYAESPSDLANAIRQTIQLRSLPQTSSPIVSPR
jgi:hypothetical protein